MGNSFLENIKKDGAPTTDVLSCLANLSNDEVFTPPVIVNQMLDMLPQELFSDPTARFLDPACKTGVFLREIAKRLIIGLEPIYPDLQERIDHIFHEQLFGIAITELTSLISRRSLYCSKYPNGPYSITHFENSEGNIRFKKIKHTWVGNQCRYCGASKKEYDRDKSLESHAYEFIHNINLEEAFNMGFFDVIIGNPPYQLSDGGGDGSSAAPIYHLFIEQSIKLNPKYLSMIIPARWYSGGKGLDDFRNNMLHDDRISIIHDYPETNDCFPGLNIRGGICYFLWDKNHHGDCLVYNHKNEYINQMTRPLLVQGSEIFVRYNKAISILQKVKQFGEKTMDTKVSSRLPFGIPSNFSNYSLTPSNDKTIILRRSERNKNAPKEVYISISEIKKNIEWKDKIKVLVSKASPGGDEYPHSIISKPIVALENTVCTETYLIVDFVKNQEEAKNLVSYMQTKFFRFMMSLIKNTQNISKGVFAFVPVQDLSVSWDDNKLYKKYNLSEDEINFIETMIKPIDTED